jgi:hypothetical protein
MAVEVVKAFPFDGSTWTLAGALERSGGVLTVEDPASQKYWNVHNWSEVPPFVGDDVVPEAGTTYTMLEDDEALDLTDDFTVTFSANWFAGGGTYFRWRLRRDTLVGDEIVVVLYRAGAAAIRLYVRKNDASYVVQDYKYGDPFWPQSCWRDVSIRVVDDSVVVSLLTDDGFRRKSAVDGLDLGNTDGGTIAFDVSLANTWTLGGGPPSSHDNPALFRKKSGTATLTSSWDVPDGAVALTMFELVYDRTNDTDGVCAADVTAEYQVNGGGWNDVPDDGDMSGVSIEPGDTIDYRVTMSNASDHRQRPGVSAIRQGYTTNALGETAYYGMRRHGYQGGPRRDGGEGYV